MKKYKGIINFILFLMSIALVVTILRMTKPIGTVGGETINIDLFGLTISISRFIRSLLVVLIYLFPLLFIRHRYWITAILLWATASIVELEKIMIIHSIGNLSGINVLFANYFVSAIEIFFLIAAIFLLIKLKKTSKQFESNHDTRNRVAG